jgi:hypothetical protein
VPLANLLLLTVSTGLDRAATQSQIWIIFILNVCFSLGFGASAIGLWQQRNWGRRLFLWMIVFWFGLNMLGLFVPELLFSANQSQTTSSLVLNGLRFVVGLILPLWYLNLPHIKVLFQDYEAA